MLSEISQRDAGTVCCNLYVESKKMVLMNLFTKKELSHGSRKQTCGYYQGGKEGRVTLGDWD